MRVTLGTTTTMLSPLSQRTLHGRQIVKIARSALSSSAFNAPPAAEDKPVYASSRPSSPSPPPSSSFNNYNNRGNYYNNNNRYVRNVNEGGASPTFAPPPFTTMGRDHPDYKEFNLELGGNRRIQVSNFGGKLRVDIREYYESTTTGELRATKKGVVLTPEQFQALKQAIPRIEAEMKKIPSTPSEPQESE